MKSVERFLEDIIHLPTDQIEESDFLVCKFNRPFVQNRLTELFFTHSDFQCRHSYTRTDSIYILIGFGRRSIMVFVQCLRIIQINLSQSYDRPLNGTIISIGVPVETPFTACQTCSQTQFVHSSLCPIFPFGIIDLVFWVLIYHIGITPIIFIAVQDKVLIQSGITVFEWIFCHSGIFPIERPAILHLKHIEKLFRWTICAPSDSLVKLPVIIRTKETSAACYQRFRIPPVKISTRISLTFRGNALVAGLHQLVKAVGIHGIKKRFASINGLFPPVFIISTEPCHPLFGSLSIGKRRI